MEDQDSPIARAIQFRQENGLRTDRAYVESVEADPSATREFGVALTSEETTGLLARQAATTDILGPLQDDLDKDSAYAGIYVDQMAGGVIVINTTADPSHLAPVLAKFGSRGVGLRARQVQYTLGELTELQERVNRDARRWTDQGVRLSSWGVDIVDNCLKISVTGLTPESASSLESAYGPRVNVVEGGPVRTAPLPPPPEN